MSQFFYDTIEGRFELLRVAFCTETNNERKEQIFTLLKAAHKISLKVLRLEAFERLRRTKQIQSWTQKIEADLEVLQLQITALNITQN